MNNIPTTTQPPIRFSQKMSTVEIAELLGKRHDHVLRDVNLLIEKDAIGLPNFGATSYLDKWDRDQPMYELDFMATMVLITGYDDKRRALVIGRWLDLETGEALPSMLPADKILIDKDTYIELLEFKIKTLTPAKPVTAEEIESFRADILAGAGVAATARKHKRHRTTIQKHTSKERAIMASAVVVP